MKKPGLMQETMSTRKPRQKKLGLEGEKRYDWIAISFEETIHWEYSFYEQCLYDMASIETTSSVLGWDCPEFNACMRKCIYICNSSLRWKENFTA